MMERISQFVSSRIKKKIHFLCWNPQQWKVLYRDAWSHCRTAPPPGSMLPPCFCSLPAPENTKREGGEGGGMVEKGDTFSAKRVDRVDESRGKNKQEGEHEAERDTEQRTLCVLRNYPPPTPNSLLCSSIQEPWGHQSHTAKIRPRQQSVAALEVPLKGSCPGSTTFIWTTICTTRMHTCEVCHWFCGGRHICFVSLLSSWTGLSICQQQSLQSTSIKPNCQTNPAFLSLFPFSSDGRKHHVSVSFLCCTFEVMSHNTTHIRI